MDRWATFDCYGTLIDWNGGIGRELERLFGAEHGRAAPARLPRARARVSARASRRELPRRADRRARRGSPSARACRSTPASRTRSRARSRSWEPFPEVPAALEDARARGWKLAILSNTDRDYIDASLAAHRRAVRVRDRRLGDRLVQAGAPSTGRRSRRRTGAAPRAHVHVGASLFHDIAPATELGLPTVWINRLGEDAEPRARRRAALAHRPRRRARLARDERQADHRRRHRRRSRALAAEDEAALHGRPSRLGADRRARLARARRPRERLVALRGRRRARRGLAGSTTYDDLGVFVGIVAQGAKGRGLGTQHRRDRRGTRRASAARRACTRSRSSADAAAASSSCGTRLSRTCAASTRWRSSSRRRRRSRRCRTGSRSRRFRDGGRARVLRGARRGVPGSLGAPLDRPSSEWWEREAERARLRSDALVPRSRRRRGRGGRSRNEPDRNGGGYVGALGVRAAVARQGARRARCSCARSREFYARGVPRVTLGVDAESPTGATKLYESVGMTVESAERRLREGAAHEHPAREVPDAAGRSPRSRSGRSTSATRAAGRSPPGSCACRAPGARRARPADDRVGVRCRSTIPRRRSSRRTRSHAQTLAVASDLPVRPLILGGCCCSHVGAVEGLAARHERLGVIWFDAHGDLNTPETSPSGNEWGMPLRMIIDGGAVDPQRRRARRRAQPRSARGRVHRGSGHPRRRCRRCSTGSTASTSRSTSTSSSRASSRCSCRSRAARPWPSVERQLGRIREGGTVVGAGLTGLAPEPGNVEKLERLTTALGLLIAQLRTDGAGLS